jgi:hypothetical protein
VVEAEAMWMRATLPQAPILIISAPVFTRKARHEFSLRGGFFQIGDEELALHAILEEVGGDMSDEEAEAAIEAWFAEIEQDVEKKVDGYCALVKHFAKVAEARKEEAKRIEAMAKADANRAEKLKTRLHEFMRTTNRPKIETLRFKVRRQTNSVAPFVIKQDYLDNPDLLPEGLYKKVPHTAAIKEAVEAGDESVLEIAWFDEKANISVSHNRRKCKYFNGENLHVIRGVGTVTTDSRLAS